MESMLANLTESDTSYVYASGGWSPSYQQWPLTAGTSAANVLYKTTGSPATYTSAASILNR